MNRRLYITALVTSPIIALYGGIPLYLFDVIKLKDFVTLTSVLSITIFCGWVLHILFIQKFPNASALSQFFGTYLANLLVRVLLLFVDKLLVLPKPPIPDTMFAYPIITSFALNAIIMIMVNSIRNSHNRAEAEKQLQALKLKNTEAQKLILMQQLQPHFLFNALSILKSLIGEDVAAAEEYTTKLSDFLRYSIQAGHEEMVTIKKELQFVQDYIDLQKIRFDNAFEYEIKIPDELKNSEIPVLSLQTLVENIFKHNYFTEKNKLHFSISVVGDCIVVRNNKVSIRLTERSKTGLQNLNMRCLLIMQKPVVITDTEETFTITLPYRK